MSAMSHVRDITRRQRRKEALTVGSKVLGDETARLSHRGTVGGSALTGGLVPRLRLGGCFERVDRTLHGAFAQLTRLTSCAKCIRRLGGMS